jgi:hypothetical protein
METPACLQLYNYTFYIYPKGAASAKFSKHCNSSPEEQVLSMWTMKSSQRWCDIWIHQESIIVLKIRSSNRLLYTEALNLIELSKKTIKTKQINLLYKS